MLDRIVLGAVRRIVGHPQLQLQTVRQLLQVFLEQVLRGTVAATTVAQNQQALGLGIGRMAMLLPPRRNAVAAQFPGVVAGVQVDVGVLTAQVVDAVGDQLALAVTHKIMVEGLDRLLGIADAGTMKIAEQFLLFCVDTDDWIARLLVLAAQARDVLELSIAVGMMSHRLLFPCRASSQFELPQQAADDASAGRGSHVD